jgi:ubiquinone/menaquinone biosynthesis C-methylase UbiE
MHGDQRTMERIRSHYEIEKRLAKRLRDAPAGDRLKLYPEVYDDLFRQLPDHEQLQMKGNVQASERETARQFGVIRRCIKPSDVYCEIGVGDCALAMKVASHVDKVYAIDVSEAITQNATFPSNLELVLSDGISIPVPAGTADIVYSNQLMEHLHPDDAEQQIASVYQALKPGGKYICITPNRLSGPHDISRYFDRAATGLHLKEYTNQELRALFKRSGFRSMRILVSWHKLVVPMLLPVWPFTTLEWLLGLLPGGVRRRVAVPIGAAKFVAIK